MSAMFWKPASQESKAVPVPDPYIYQRTQKTQEATTTMHDDGEVGAMETCSRASLVRVRTVIHELETDSCSYQWQSGQPAQTSAGGGKIHFLLYHHFICILASPHSYPLTRESRPFLETTNSD